MTRERDLERPVKPVAWNDFREPVRFRFTIPSAPFARLALTHAVGAAGDALVAIALAKTLFFVSPNEARGKVLLYLLVTLAPFAVVSPFVGPLIDRFSKQRKAVLVGSFAARGLLCFLLMRDYDSWALFPETFGLLVLSKGYAVARNAVIPSVVTRSSELVRANSKLALLAGVGGVVAAIPGGVLSLLGPGWVAFFAALVFGGAALLASTLILAEEPFAVDGGPTVPDVRRENSTSTSTSKAGQSSRSFLTELRLAVILMSGQRLLIGMVTFLAAFTLKRENAATVWLGIVAGLGIIGGLVGSTVAPRLRARSNEMTMLLGGAIGSAVICFAAAFKASRFMMAIVAFCVAMGANIGRLAYDSLLQRYGNVDERGASFARSESRFQLAWVLGALIPVAAEISRTVGFLLMAFISALMIVVEVGGERSLRSIDETLAAGRSRWHRPARPSDADWLGEDETP